MTTAASAPSIGWVVLTIGTDLDELRACLESIRRQAIQGPVVVVTNGVEVQLPDWVRELALPENVGIPGGRQRGLEALDDVDVVACLDDDAVLLHDQVAERIVATMADPRVAAVSLAIMDRDGNHQQRFVPRLGSSGADRSGDVTYYAGCAHALRRSAFLDVGGYDPDFFYGHEESDLSWRLLDAGHRIVYDARPAVEHPQVDPRAMDLHRHRRLARNRVWMARRNLPAPLHWAYAGAWYLRRSVALRGSEAGTAWRSAWHDAWDDEVQRRPISWRTVVRMTRLGRPPLL